MNDALRGNGRAEPFAGTWYGDGAIGGGGNAGGNGMGVGAGDGGSFYGPYGPNESSGDGDGSGCRDYDGYSPDA